VTRIRYLEVQKQIIKIVLGPVQWFRPVIPATWEAEIKRTGV
jgi:hypothetical protein